MAAAQLIPLVAGNWKMNGLSGSRAELAKIIAAAEGLAGKTELMVCPPATLVAGFATAARGSQVILAGRIVMPMHQARILATFRLRCWQTQAHVLSLLGILSGVPTITRPTPQIRAKAQAAWRAGLTAIVCVGEQRAEREAGKTLGVVGGQLDGSLADGGSGANLVVAYEPVWAIGTGLTPTAADVAEVHAFVRKRLVERFGTEGARVRILYGGSVKSGQRQRAFDDPRREWRSCGRG